MKRSLLALIFMCAAFATLNLVLGVTFGHWYSYLAAAWSATAALFIAHTYRSLS